MINIGQKINEIRGFLSFIVILLILPIIFYVISAAFAETDKITVLFYSCETNINNFKSLKMEFDGYLSRYGPYEFQPFSDRDSFEKYIKDKENCLLLLSSWHYRNIHKEYALKSALVGVRDGKKHQKRLLVARGITATVESVKTGRVASASSAEHTGSVLRTMLKEQYTAGTFGVLTVPKDIDALMSVGFGMSKSALTTRNALEELSTLNPMLYKKMKILMEGEESLLLILAVPERFTKHLEKMVTIIKDMPTDPDGKRKLRMLGLDGFQTIDPSDRSELEG